MIHVRVVQSARKRSLLALQTRNVNHHPLLLHKLLLLLLTLSRWTTRLLRVLLTLLLGFLGASFLLRAATASATVHLLLHTLALLVDEVVEHA